MVIITVSFGLFRDHLLQRRCRFGDKISHQAGRHSSLKIIFDVKYFDYYTGIRTIEAFLRTDHLPASCGCGDDDVVVGIRHCGV